MSVLVTSNIVKHATGLPFQPLPLLDLVETTSFLKQNKLGFDVLDGQKITKEQWVEEISAKSPKILLVVLNEPYLQLLKGLKDKLGEEITVVVVTESEELINTLIFDYGLDYVYFDKNKTGLGELLPALVNPFAMFYDHILGLAYKNGLGELTKTDTLKISSDFHLVLTKGVTNGHKSAYLPFGVTIENTDTDIINASDKNVLTDFVKYDSKVQYDVFYLKIPASKKIKRFIGKLIEEQDNLDELHIYPSCDILEDKKFYSGISSVLELAQEVKKAGWFKRIFLKMKLNKLL